MTSGLAIVVSPAMAGYGPDIPGPHRNRPHETTPGARIINVSSGAGSLTLHCDPAFPFRPGFSPLYHASKTALNAMTLAMAIELEPCGVRVSAVSPGHTKTHLNNYSGGDPVEEGAREAVRMALMEGGPTGTFTHATLGTLPW